MRLPGLREPDMTRQLAKLHCRADLPRCIKQRLAKLAVTKATAKSGHGLALRIGVSFGHALHALGGDGLCDVRLHLDEDEAAGRCLRIRCVHLQDRVSSGARTRKAVEDEIAGVRGDL